MSTLVMYEFLDVLYPIQEFLNWRRITIDYQSGQWGRGYNIGKALTVVVIWSH